MAASVDEAAIFLCFALNRGTACSASTDSPINAQFMKDRLTNLLDTALMFNLFFVLLSFGWFAIALIGRAANVNLGFDLWYSLWDSLFMPAIGVLMAGALVSGISSWVSKKFLSKQEGL